MCRKGKRHSGGGEEGREAVVLYCIGSDGDGERKYGVWMRGDPVLSGSVKSERLTYHDVKSGKWMQPFHLYNLSLSVFILYSSFFQYIHPLHI